ncbi:Neutral ceramidase [Grifola frondosa]|uniref:Neutral ceramidase n=1 Tax=Grifola frondosa TaxID=5627 RepID=A0A1C7LNN2_GRIFR|nr:Neutral ceramidase [Grifola frondosa]
MPSRSIRVAEYYYYCGLPWPARRRDADRRPKKAVGHVFSATTGTRDSASANKKYIYRMADNHIIIHQSYAILSFSGYIFTQTSGLLPNGSAASAGVQAVSAQYLLGLGIADITGPVVETNMMGYASLAQTDTGLHMRQRSRAWIIADASEPSNRVVFINADIAMGDTGVRRSIVSALSSEFPGLYTNENIALVSTHQHSGVGGYLENLLPQITSLGYVKQTADAITAGTVLAVQRAHASLAPGALSVGNTTVLDANINRSPSAYLANPADERAKYEYDQDKELTLLRFDDASGNPRGFLSFFPVHGTSLYENNTLVSGDNKGMAAYLYESMVEPSSMPGNNTFVAGFTQANVGDTSPNTLGAFCESPGEPWDGQPCEFEHSTCGNTTEDCHGRGPGFLISDFESDMIIAQYQVDGAKTLMSQTLPAVSGPVRWVHTYMNMSFRSFTLPNGTTVQTCPPAMGYSFAGGTTDGPGAFDFIQGDNSSDPQNPFWEIVKGAVTPLPPPEQIACQFPKPILLDTGYAHIPYNWSPDTVDIQMLRVGNFVMLIIPGELTTMSGRRMREAIRSQLISSGIIGDDAYVVIAGPANTYAHYVATREEYSVQRYEGASTIFGPFTLESYIDKYSSLVSYLADNATGSPASDPAPPDLSGSAISLQLPVIVDNAIGNKFGDVLADVSTSVPYSAGDSVVAQFVGANPRNNLRLEGTFLTVDQLVNGEWTAVRSDSHPSTIYQWTRTSTILGTSTVNITWTIESGTPAGTYRLSYFGDSKSLFGTISPFIGHSSNFTIA